MINGLYEFWFGDTAAPQAAWFKKDAEFDRELATEFAPLIASHLEVVPRNARERLTLILLFDQIPRNSYRNDPRSFAYDQRALALAKDGLAHGDFETLSVTEALFLLLPLEHSEALGDQRECVRLMGLLEKKAPAELKTFAGEILEFARKHERIVARFGRFPTAIRSWDGLRRPRRPNFSPSRGVASKPSGRPRGIEARF